MTESSLTADGFLAAADALHDAARAAVGFDDFGDPSYLHGFRILLEAYDREARLTLVGRAIVEPMLVGILKNRLIAEKLWKDRPEILDSEIRSPIFIIGLPRTGTTALHHLLGRDPRHQVLEYWLAENPCPRPPRETWEGDPRYQAAVQELETVYRMDPGLKAIHLLTADGPEECRHLLMQSFTDDTFDCNATIPSYSRWYGAHDMLPTYRRHRDLLKLIGSPTSQRRWLLKYPVHMGNLHAVLQTYPDACFVHTHRDPGKVVGSICSLVAGWRAIYEGEVDRPAIAAWLIELWASRLERYLEERRKHDPRQFFDLSFREIVADPIGAVRRVYAHFGIELTEEAERGFRAWQEENPRGKHGEHRYHIADFCVTERDITDRFAAYMDHFAVEQET